MSSPRTLTSGHAVACAGTLAPARTVTRQTGRCSWSQTWRSRSGLLVQAEHASLPPGRLEHGAWSALNTPAGVGSHCAVQGACHVKRAAGCKASILVVSTACSHVLWFSEGSRHRLCCLPGSVALRLRLRGLCYVCGGMPSCLDALQHAREQVSSGQVTKQGSQGQECTRDGQTTEAAQLRTAPTEATRSHGVDQASEKLQIKPCAVLVLSAAG